MSKLKLFCAEDLKIGIFFPPKAYLHTGQALRDWEDIVNDPKNIIGKYPQDFRFSEIGTFDDQTGRVETYDKPVIIASPGEYLKSTGSNPVDPRQGDLLGLQRSVTDDSRRSSASA